MGLFDSFAASSTGNKAVQAHRKGNYAEAEKLYREAVSKGLDNASMLSNFASLLVRRGEFDEALEVIKKMEKSKSLTEKDKLNMHVYYAIILWKKGHLDHAIEILEDDFKHAKNGNLYSVIGYLLIEQGNADKALEFNLASLEYDDEDPVFLENVALTYYRLLDDKPKAMEYFRKAYAIRQSSIDSNYFLALQDIEDGHLEDARKKLMTAAEGRFSQLNYATPEKIREKLEEISE